ncbi:POTRA domain-containing protein [Aureivirga sp. CE67]|uniref:POTRA domain-containing protein n=1 Tax=Aureivirga sp. CE67 TaxID=1788983 RepID=UPI0018C947EE|nr:POTRA domain-containing protein [Aureivirga sp. CE67]
MKALNSTKKNLNESNSITYKNHFKEKDSLLKEVVLIQEKLQSQGYFNVSLIHQEIIQDTTLVQFKLGQKTDTIKIHVKKEDLAYFDKKDWDISKDNTFIVAPEKLEKLLNTIVSSFENNGFTFSNVSLNNIYLDKNIMEADLVIEKSTFRKIDTVIIEGYKNFPRSFVKHKLRLKKGSSFSKEKLTNASKILNSIPFVQEIKSPQILFTKDTTAVYLYLKKQNRNVFDGLIGLNSDEESGKIKFNGHLRLELYNLFNNGEEIKIRWESQPDEKTLLNIGAKIPYIFNSPISPEANLEIYKQDSSFVSTKFNFGLTYSLNAQNELGGYYSSESSSNLLNSTLANQTFEDFDNQFYGLRYRNINYNNSILQPLKFYFEISPSIGTRKAKENLTQQKITLKSFYLWQLNRRNFIFLQNQSAHLNSTDYILNELFRIGGASSLRGFNENSIFASSYSIFNIEYRYLLSNLSYLYSITDFAYINNELDEISSNGYGLGIGYVYFKNNSKINLSYAIGSFQNQNFNINNSKFHIKFSYFF